jgi:hypothetical protein
MYFDKASPEDIEGLSTNISSINYKAESIIISVIVGGVNEPSLCGKLLGFCFSATFKPGWLFVITPQY